MTTALAGAAPPMGGLGVGVCRLTICGPARQADLAVPAGVVLADLMPVLLNHLGEDLADNGLGHGGWILQRMGGPAFDEDRTVAALGLRDGDIVYLRARAHQLPEADFDDLIDGVATAVRDRSGKWRPVMTRWAAAILLATVLLAGLAVLALPTTHGQRAVIAGVIAIGCLVTAFASSRETGAEPGLRGVAIVLAAGAIGYAAMAGLSAPNPFTESGGLIWSTPQIFTGAVAVLAVVVTGFFTIAWARPLFAGVLASGVLFAVAGGLGTLSGLSLVQVAGVLAVLATVALMMVPTLAFRLAGLRLAPLPTAPEHLQEDLDPVPSDMVMRRSATADRYMTFLYAGLSVPISVALIMLGAGDGWAAPALAVVVALVLMLASRPMTSGWHRLALLVAAASGLVGTAVQLSISDETVRLLVPAVMVPLGIAASVLIARFIPGRRLMPYWGRIGDMTHIVAAVAMLPILLAVLDVYSRVRAIGG
jgi:type VII secretion integral membrane protein EccD